MLMGAMERHKRIEKGASLKSAPLDTSSFNFLLGLARVARGAGKSVVKFVSKNLLGTEIDIAKQAQVHPISIYP